MSHKVLKSEIMYFMFSRWYSISTVPLSWFELHLVAEARKKLWRSCLLEFLWHNHRLLDSFHHHPLTTTSAHCQVGTGLINYMNHDYDFGKDLDSGFILRRQVIFIKIQIEKWESSPYIGYSIFLFWGKETSLKIIQVPKTKQKNFKDHLL